MVVVAASVVVVVASSEVVVVGAASCEVVVVVGAGGSGSAVQSLVEAGLRHSTASMPAFLSMKTPLLGSLRLSLGGKRPVSMESTMSRRCGRMVE